jgi:hypothetical protein
MPPVIIKKGYYVVNAATLQLASGTTPIATPEEAEARWEEISQATPGPSKFFIMWVPKDNYAWGEEFPPPPPPPPPGEP